MFISSTTYAAELKSLDFSALPGNKAKIQLVFSEPIAKPNSFSTDEPARIIVDFAGVANKLQERTKQVNVGVTRSISTVEAGERTRMVINLLQKAPYVISQNGNQMEITIDNANATQTTQRRSQSGMTTVTDVDFRRGEEGEARLIVKLDGEEAAMDVRQERGDIVIELANVALPDKLHRRLDVIDFATPVKFIDSDASANATKLTLTTEGRYEHLAYQSENTLVVEVKPLPDQPQAGQDRNQFGYSGEKLSLNFQNIEVRAVLQLLADFTGMNLVTSDTVKGNLTLRLKNVPWDQALDIILKTKGLAMRQNGNVLMVAPAAEIAAREKQELEAQKQLVELEPLYTEIVEIKFAKADLLATLLRTDGKQGGNSGQSGFLSPRGSITIDDRTNSLLIRDTADNLVDIRQVIDELDKPVRQVLIESRIVIANNDFNKELGVRFGTSAQSNTLGAGSSGSLTGLSTNPNNDDQIRANSVVGNDLNVNLPVSNPSGSIGLALAKLPLGMILELELSAMQAEGKGEVISSPRVITSNQQQATIEQGTEIPYQEATSSGATNVSFKEAVLKLDVTPQITPDDRIVMDLEVSKDEVGEVFLGVPSIDTRSVKTQVLVDNGETVVLGGIYEQSTNDNVERVPFFGDLPYVGFLFKNTFKEDRKRELLVFVTPKIVKEGLQY
ncbi:type IV pilus secretin PilQ [Methylophaga thiooxydans]|uniref:Type IV pilus secretin PilQ subfamily, putative n=1 Tax=Methylophaga thiooxydans DMS010 TaxID=637616 RepID=C0N3G3_9GAMM|nr:type IV pilus secretin PilQ [Methylophaga thiooxydans]EEF80670.1 type IV pilus secretin PilQ subfamily, putative [Methylophaga thiooxydans DMS010]